MYIRLARREEADMKAQFGEAWQEYSVGVPRFVPRLRSPWTHHVSPLPGTLLPEPGPPALQREVPGVDRLTP